MRHRLLQKCVFYWLLGICAPAWAADLSVNPVRIEFSPGRLNAAIQIVNFGDEAVTVQAHVLDWSAAEGAATFRDDILLNPPIFTVAGHHSQFLRLGLRRHKESDSEAFFRLVLEEVPKPPPPGFAGLRTLLRIRIPIFVRPTGATLTRVAWEAVPEADGQLRIIAVNQGNVHVQVQTLELQAASGSSVRVNKMHYLMPNEKHEWLVDASELGKQSEVMLKVATDAGLMHETILLKAR